jgi:hypothetical protein
MRPLNIQFKNPISNIQANKTINLPARNKPKNPYADLITVFIFLVNQLIFLFRAGSFIVIHSTKAIYKGSKFVYVTLFPEKIQDKPISVVDQYIENKKQRFLETYNNNKITITLENYSSNIDPCFLSKKEYENVLKNEDNDIEKIWKTRILCENTPRGNIFMSYDVYKQGFTYYSDIQGLQYSLLNAVAMKYVIMFRCRDFFVDDQITPTYSPSFLIKLQEEEAAEEKEKQEKKKEDLGVVGMNTKNAPFAKFKTYNNATSKMLDNKNNSANITNSAVDSDKIFTCNKFIYLGKIANFSILQRIPMKTPTIKRDIMTGDGRILDELRADRKWLNYNDYKESISWSDPISKQSNVVVE